MPVVNSKSILATQITERVKATAKRLSERLSKVAVSYTHLDVYKRQILKRIRIRISEKL